MNINYELYKMFQRVAQTGSFTKTAEENFISQSAVTQAMKKLENQLGETLFIRSKTGVTLTPQGQNLYEYIDSSLDTLNSAENLFDKYKNLETGELRICCESSLVRPILMDPLAKFATMYPNIKIRCSVDTYEKPLERIATGNLDVCIFLNPVKNDYECVSVEDFADSDMCFFTSKDYYDNEIKHKITIKDLPKYTLVFPDKGSSARKWIDKKLEEKGVQVDPRITISNGSFAAGFVNEYGGIGYGSIAVSKRIMGDNFVNLIDDFDQERKEVAVAHLKKKVCTAATLEFLKLLGE